MNITRAVVASASFALLSDATAGLTQWRVEDGGNDHWYALISASGGITWTDAQAAAAAQGGYLGTITSPQENAFVFNLISSSGGWGNPWVGGFQPDPASKPDQGWAWVTGEAWYYTNWAAGEPNDWGGIFGAENYLGFRRSDGTWNDLPNQGDGGATFSYVIEFGAVPAPSAASLIALAGLTARGRRRK